MVSGEAEAKGLLSSELFKATRAFQVEEFEDEGLHYFIELADGTVLYLNGQYLYDYEEPFLPVCVRAADMGPS